MISSVRYGLPQGWWIAWGLALVFLSLSLAEAQVKAFPTAEGFGAQSRGGRGGRAIIVNRLDDPPGMVEGTLRYCVENTGPRTCIFHVGGTIPLTRVLEVSYENRSYLTIAGQTAPGGGIAITGYPLGIYYGGHDVIIRHFRMREARTTEPPGPPEGSGINDCGGILAWGDSREAQVYNVILDHVSVAYVCDDSTSAFGAVANMTLQWSIVGEGYDSEEGDPFGQSKGFISGSSQTPGNTASLHHNLFIHMGYRIPNAAGFDRLDIRNNIVFNWGFSYNLSPHGPADLGTTSDFVFTSIPLNVNFVGNKYFNNSVTPGCAISTSRCSLGSLLRYTITQVYQRDNHTSICPGEVCAPNAWDIGWTNSQGQDFSGIAEPALASTFRTNIEFSAPPITMHTLAELDSKLAAQAGATVPRRDDLDTRLISEWQERTGNLGRRGEPVPFLANGSPLQDSDGDGMPDSWESARGAPLNPFDDTDGAQCSSGSFPNCYTWLELYLNEKAGDGTVITDPPDPCPPDCPATCPPDCPAGTAAPIFLSAGGHGDIPSDGYSCLEAETITKPFATWGKACTCMNAAGKILEVRGGIYPAELNTLACPVTGGSSWSTPTIIRGYANEVATFQLQGPGVALFLRNADRYLQIEKLVFDANNKSNSNGAALYDGVQHIRLRDLVIKNTVGGYEAVFHQHADDVEYLRVRVVNSGDVGISLLGNVNNITIDESDIDTTGLVGIDIASISGTATNVTVRRTKVHNAGTLGTAPAIAVGASTGTTLTNNLVYDSDVGIRVQSGASMVRIDHNTIANNAGLGLQCDSGATNVQLRNTLLWLNGTNPPQNTCGLTLVTNQWTSTPNFVDPGNDDYRLQGNSTAINAGTTLPEVTMDFLGVARPQGSKSDIGAYEQANPPAEIPPMPMKATAVEIQSWFH
jgi:parallel beta-helix repeat protein